MKKNPKLAGGICIAVLAVLILLGMMKVYRSMMESLPDGVSGSSQSDVSSEQRPDGSGQPEEFHEKALRQRCQAILDDYSARLRALTPQLMEEFKAEAEGVSDGRKLSLICREKVDRLAELSNDGLVLLWDTLYESGLEPSHPDYGRYDDYEERLDRVYEDEAGKLSQLYSEYYILHAS